MVLSYVPTSQGGIFLELPRSSVPALVLLSALIFLAGFLAGWTPPAASRPADHDLLYQVSTYTSLSGGGYSGFVPVGEFMEHGDLGLGTFDGLDGEMVVLDGQCYQVKADGSVANPAPSALVPFAAVTPFEADIIVPGITAPNLSRFTAALDASLPSHDTFWAVRMTGSFPYVKARSPPKQARPYAVLTDALKNQSVFLFHNVSGTVVGFYTPASAAGVDPVGFHLHFITADRQAGGHVLDISTDGDPVELDSTSRIILVLPGETSPPATP